MVGSVSIRGKGGTILRTNMEIVVARSMKRTMVASTSITGRVDMTGEASTRTLTCIMITIRKERSKVQKTSTAL